EKFSDNRFHKASASVVSMAVIMLLHGLHMSSAATNRGGSVIGAATGSKHPQQIEEQPVLFLERAGRVVDLSGLHVTQVHEQRAVGMITGDDLMAPHVGSPAGGESKVIVIEPVPDGGGADVLVVITELPVAFGLGAAKSDTEVVGFAVAPRVGAGRIPGILPAGRDRELALKRGK